MATEYKLKTLRDVYERVPTDKLELCMREIAEGMVYARHLAEMMNTAAKALDPAAAAQGIWPDECTWVDDGKEDKTINVHDADSGELAMTLKVEKSA